MVVFFQYQIPNLKDNYSEEKYFIDNYSVIKVIIDELTDFSKLTINNTSPPITT